MLSAPATSEGTTMGSSFPPYGQQPEPSNAALTLLKNPFVWLAGTAVVALLAGGLVGHFAFPTVVGVPVAGPTTTLPGPTRTVTAPAPTVTATVTAAAANPSPDPADTAPLPPTVGQPAMYLSELDPSAFVRDPQWSRTRRGPSTINGTEYPDSLLIEWSNCSNCNGDLEFKVPTGYTQLTGTFGLSDDTRHDEVIDGVERFAIKCSDGRTLVKRTRIEYPHSVPVKTAIKNCARVTITISGGTNYETFVMGDARLS